MQAENEDLRKQLSTLAQTVSRRDVELARLRGRIAVLVRCVAEQDRVLADLREAAGLGADDGDSSGGGGASSSSSASSSAELEQLERAVARAVAGSTGAAASEENGSAPHRSPAVVATGMLRAHLASMRFSEGQVQTLLQDLALPAPAPGTPVAAATAAAAGAAGAGAGAGAQRPEDDGGDESHEDRLLEAALQRVEADEAGAAAAVVAELGHGGGGGAGVGGEGGGGGGAPRKNLSMQGLLGGGGGLFGGEDVVASPVPAARGGDGGGGGGGAAGDAGPGAVAAADVASQQLVQQQLEMTYNGFLERLRRPGSRDLVDAVRRFMGAVLGPLGDGSPPSEGEAEELDYAYRGLRGIEGYAKSFFAGMEKTMETHPAWRYGSEATLLAARDGVEKYVMVKLCPFVLGADPVELEDDERLMRRTRALSFVTPDHLDIKPEVRNDVVWSIAGDELRKIERSNAPGDKIACVVNCCSVLFSVLNLARGDGDSRPGADDFLPVFIYVVLKARVPSLWVHSEFVRKFRNSADLMSKAGYCFVNLQSAIEFILNVDGSMLSCDTDEFDASLAKAEAALDAEEARERPRQ